MRLAKTGMHVLLAITLLIGLSACGSGSQTTDATSPTDTTNTTPNDTSDTTKPVIKLNGNSPVTVEAGSTYTDDNATVTDNVDATNTALTGTGAVDTSKVGSYTITYNVTDAAGNAATAVTRIVNVVDTTKPVITLNSNSTVIVEAGSTYTDAKATVTDNADATNASLAGTGTVDTSKIGSYTITYNATDTAGNAATAISRTVNVVDTTKPVIKINGGTPVTVAVGGTYTDAKATVTDNASATNTALAGTGTVDTSKIGSYTITYNATDTAGNAALPVTRTVKVVDATPPVIALNGVNPSFVEMGQTYTDSKATVTDNIDPINTALVGVSNVNTNKVGTYTVTYNATDKAGNTATTVKRTVTVQDTTAPSAAIISSPADGATVTTTTPTVSGTAEANSVIQLYKGSGLLSLVKIGTVTTDSNGNWSITTSSLSTGRHTISTVVTDVSGNSTAFFSSSISITVTITDTTAPAKPIISSPSNGAIITTVNMTTSGTAEASALVKLYDTDGTTVLGSATADGAGAWSISNPIADGAHTLTVKATDAAGNTSVASTGLSISVDTTAPIKPVFITTSGTVNTATPAISGSTEAGATVKLFDTNGTTVLGSTTAAGNGLWSITSSSLTSGAHTLTAKAIDAAGNTSVVSANLSITVSISTSLSGSVVDGKVSGATLTIFSDKDMLTQIGSGSTNATGAFNVTLTVSSAPNPVYILSTGGTDIDTGLAAPTMSFVGESAGANGLSTFNVTPLTKDIYDRVHNGSTLNTALNDSFAAFGSPGGSAGNLYNDPSASGNTVLKTAAFKKLASGTGGGTIDAGTYKMFALTIDEGSIGTATITSIADLTKSMASGGQFFVEADITIDSNGNISGHDTGSGQFMTGKVIGSSMVFNLVDSITSAPTRITRIVGNIGLNGSVSGNFSSAQNLTTTPSVTKGIFVGSIIPATGIKATGLNSFINGFYSPGASTGMMNIVARDIFGTGVPRVRWGQAAVTAINVTNGTATMSDFTAKSDAGSVAAASQTFAFSSGTYVKSTTGSIPTNIMVFEYKLPPISSTSDKLYIATVVGLRKGIYFMVPNATGKVAMAGESYMSKVDSISPSPFTAGATHDIVTANINLGMIGQARTSVLTQGLTPTAVPGGMPIPNGFNTSNSFMDTSAGAPELMVFQGSMFIMKQDTNNDFANNSMSSSSGSSDHLRVVEFFESGAMQGEEIIGGNFPTGSSPMSGQTMRSFPATFIGFVHNQSGTAVPAFTGKLNILARTIYAADYSNFNNAYTSGTLTITTAPTTSVKGVATLVVAPGSSTTTTTSNLSIDMLASSNPGVYHIHGALTGGTEYIDVTWAVGGTKALYAISNSSAGTGNITELGEAFITQ